MGRELEFKYLADGVQFDHAVDFLKKVLTGAQKFESGSYVSTYFKTSGSAKYLRFNVDSNGDGELTVKVNDKGTTQDRKEWNHKFCRETIEDTLEMFTAALGEPQAIIWRFAEWKVDNAIFSVVMNVEKPQWTFVEVEAQDIQTLNAWGNVLTSFKELNLKQVKNSMHDIFVEREGVKL